MDRLPILPCLCEKQLRPFRHWMNDIRPISRLYQWNLAFYKVNYPPLQFKKQGLGSL